MRGMKILAFVAGVLVFLLLGGCSELTQQQIETRLNQVDQGVRSANQNGVNAVGIVHVKAGGHIGVGPALFWDGPVDAYLVVTGDVAGYGQGAILPGPGKEEDPIEEKD